MEGNTLQKKTHKHVIPYRQHHPLSIPTESSSQRFDSTACTTRLEGLPRYPVLPADTQHQQSLTTRGSSLQISGVSERPYGHLMLRQPARY